jgi:hypothetical protein
VFLIARNNRRNPVHFGLFAHNMVRSSGYVYAEFQIVTMPFSMMCFKVRRLRYDISLLISDDMRNRCVCYFPAIIVNGLAASLLALKERGEEGHAAVKGNRLNI